MATDKQIEANRQNSLKSTGPKTPEGKAKVSRNALVHGFRARHLLLHDENKEEFHQLCDDLAAEWQPQSRTEEMLLEQMAICYVKLARMEAGERDVISKDAYQIETLGDPQLTTLNRISQYQGRIERSYFRALRELRQLQKERRKAGQVAEPAHPLEPAAPSAEDTSSALSPYFPDLVVPETTQAPEPRRE